MIKTQTKNKPNGLYCSVCGKPQVETPSGPTCVNSHGGADGLTPAELKARAPKKKGILDQAKPAKEMASREAWKARVGLFGPSKSGKTLSSTTMPPYYQGKHKPRLLIDCDGRSQTVAGIPDLEVISVFDPDPKLPKAWNKLEAIKKELWSLARAGRFPYSVVIEDGGTMMGRYCMSWALLLDPKRGLGGAPAQQHYIPQMKNFADHVLSMKELPCHYIFNGHLELTENPSDESVLYLPKVIGKTARTEFSGWFDDIYYTQRNRGKGGDIVYSWITKGTGKLDFFGSTLNNRGKYWEDPVILDLDKDPAGFAYLLDKRFGKEKKDNG